MIKSEHRNTLYPQVLAGAELDGRQYIFATGQDQQLWQVVRENGSWQEWEASDQLLQSQPSAIVWGTPQQISVFAIGAADGKVITKPFKNDVWGDWQSLKANASSPVVACNPGRGESVHIWIREDGDAKSVIHNYWEGDNKRWHSEWSDWEYSMNNDVVKGSISTPGIVCRNTTIFHDVVILEKDSGMALHKQWGFIPSSWTAWEQLGGPFTGDPVVVSPALDRVDLFGILKADHTMVHQSWNQTSNYTEPLSLGGNWSSIPSVTVSDNNRLDVFALSTDGTIKHRAVLDSDWNADWDDLGISASSAPLTIQPKNDSTMVTLLVLENEGELVYSDWVLTAGGGLKNIAPATSIRGKFNSTGMAVV